MIEIKFEENRAAAYDGTKEIGECTFAEQDGVWVLNHTFVDSSYGGQGIAKKLLKCVTENALLKKKKCRAVCSYVVREFEKNADEYKDVIL